MKKVLSIIGTRPQYIKYSAIEHELKIRPRSDIEFAWLDTMQHYSESMSEVFYNEFNLSEPVMKLTAARSQVPLFLEDYVKQINPDLVVVYGDTDTTLFGALAATRNNISLAHVESGCRSGNWEMKEETNRVVADALADLHFPVDVYGDLHADSLSRFDLDRVSGSYVLLTLHRPNNVDDAQRLNLTLNELSKSSLPIKYVTHHRVDSSFLYQRENFTYLEPQKYEDMLNLINNAEVIVTDSGGIQREAYMLGKPVITLRDETEWKGTLWNDCNVLATPLDLVSEISRERNPKFSPNLFRTGAAQKIIREISEWLNTE